MPFIRQRFATTRHELGVFGSVTRAWPPSPARHNEYGWSCALAYERVLHRFSPDLQAVDAFVRWPETGRVRRRYKRLLMPFRTYAGEAHVLSATVEDPTIDLRTTAH